MGKPSKFSKLAGPQKVLYASLDAATPTLASDSVVFLQSGTAKKVTFADMMTGVDGTVTSTGLSSADGVLSVNIAGLDAKATPIAADSVMVCDSADNDALKEVTLTNLAKPLADVMAGTAATTGLTDASGVLTVAAKIAHLVADEKSSLFFEALEVDFGVATAVDTKITDAAAAKGKLILALGVVTEVFDGDANNTISISNNTLLGANKMCSDIVVNKDTGTVGDWLGSVFAGAPVSGADATVTAGNDIYAYSAANNNRGNGKMYFVLVFQKNCLNQF